MGERELFPEKVNSLYLHFLMEQLFIMFTSLLIISTIMVIISINPIHSIFWLVIVFLFTSGLLITLKIEFLSLMVIIIYVGAITILFLFVIMMLDIIQLKKVNSVKNILPIIFLGGVIIMVKLWLLLNIKKSYIFINNSFNNWNFNYFNHIYNIGQILYTNYAYLIIIISILLLIAMIGAIILTLELNTITKKQDLSIQQKRNNSWI